MLHRARYTEETVSERKQDALQYSCMYIQSSVICGGDYLGVLMLEIKTLTLTSTCQDQSINLPSVSVPNA